jgi:hypothetical protein
MESCIGGKKVMEFSTSRKTDTEQKYVASHGTKPICRQNEKRDVGITDWEN